MRQVRSLCAADLCSIWLACSASQTNITFTISIMTNNGWLISCSVMQNFCMYRWPPHLIFDEWSCYSILTNNICTFAIYYSQKRFTKAESFRWDKKKRKKIKRSALFQALILAGFLRKHVLIDIIRIWHPGTHEYILHFFFSCPPFRAQCMGTQQFNQIRKRKWY